MKIMETGLPGVLLLEPKVFGDARGFFLESYNKRQFDEAAGTEVEFVQDNHSRSTKGVLRGIHYQWQQAQGKLVRVVEGEVFDIAVDLRKSSSAFGKWYGAHLSAENHHMLWVPPGFGHAFLVLSDNAQFLYKTTNFYAPQFERSIVWNDAEIGIKWPSIPGLQEPLLSDKDRNASSLKDAETYQ